MAARLIPQWEIIDYAAEGKRDAPSETVRELAARLSRIRPAELTVPLEETQGVVETRGARLGGAQIHSVRLPGYTISVEILFGMTDSGYPSATTPARAPSRMWTGRCWPFARSVRLWGCGAGWMRC